MATAQVQHASASFGADGTQSAARVGRDGALVIRSHAEQLGIEGKIFIAGVGLEGTALTGLTTAVDDTTPSLWLQAPAGGNVLIRPLWFEALVTAEGGAAPDWYLNLITTNINMSAGTIVTPQCIGDVGSTSAAILAHTATVGAITNAQNVRLRSSENALDNLISVEHINGANTDKDDYMNSLTTIKYEFPVPIYMADGQAMAFYSFTVTTGQAFEWILVYAELDAATYR